jgi:hypothetical protein
MTRTGLRSLGTALTAFVVGLAATTVGCASVGPVTPVAASDIKAVTGTWKGVVYTKSEFEPDYVTLTIRGTVRTTSCPPRHRSAPPAEGARS